MPRLHAPSPGPVHRDRLPGPRHRLADRDGRRARAARRSIRATIRRLPFSPVRPIPFHPLKAVGVAVRRSRSTARSTGSASELMRRNDEPTTRSRSSIDDRVAVLTFNRPEGAERLRPGARDAKRWTRSRTLAARRARVGDRRARRRPRVLGRLRSQGRRGHRRPARSGGMAARARSGFRLHHGLLALPEADDRRGARLLHRRRVRAVARLRRHGRGAVDAGSARPKSSSAPGAVALLLPWIAGPKAAKELLLTGDDKLTAERALALGIVNHVGAGRRGVRRGAGDRARHGSRGAERRAPDQARDQRAASTRWGLRAALAAALELDIFIESAGGPERAEFDRIRREEGLKAAIAWRDSGRGGVLR